MLKTGITTFLTLYVISLQAQQHPQFSSYKDAGGVVHQSYIYVSDPPPARRTPGYTPTKETYPTYPSGSKASQSGKYEKDESAQPPVIQNGFGSYTYPDRNTYTGWFVNGLREGTGVLTRYGNYKDTIYAGEWKKDKFEGKGTYKGEWSFTGQFKNGDFNGYGVLTHLGDRYEGYMENDLKNGRGTMYYANGDKFEGHWLNGKKNLDGTYTWANGEKYAGEYFLDQMNGNGKLYDRTGKLIKEGSWDAGSCVSKLPTHIMPNRDIYYGVMKNDKYDGQGICKYSDGSKYDGHFTDGLRDGEGTLLTSDGVVYTGSWVHGKKQGYGTQTDADGTYNGPFSNDTMDGYGSIKYKAGGEFTGYFKHGAFNGQGTRIDAAGNKWTGEWKNDHLDGKGTYTGADGVNYAGDYRAGKADGKGILTFPDGRRMEGDFVKGQMEGKGILTTQRGERYDGSWAAGLPNGHGTYTDSAGGKYTGEYLNNTQDGEGEYVAPDGTKYSGHWKNDKRDGYGTLYTRTGAVEYQGIWKNDKFTTSNSVLSIKKVIESASRQFADAKGELKTSIKDEKLYSTPLLILVDEPVNESSDAMIIKTHQGISYSKSLYFKTKSDRNKFLEKIEPLTKANNNKDLSDIKLPDYPGVTIRVDTLGLADVYISIGPNNNKK